MAARSEFVDHLHDMLAPLGDVRVRSMFGGYGVYLDGVMFGLIGGDTLYLKVDDANRGDFEAAGMGPFIYQRAGREPTAMSYYQAPADTMEDPDTLVEWARNGAAAAFRADAAKSPGKRKGKRKATR